MSCDINAVRCCLIVFASPSSRFALSMGEPCIIYDRKKGDGGCMLRRPLMCCRASACFNVVPAALAIKPNTVLFSLFRL